MGGERRSRFELTPHKLMTCILLYACATTGAKCATAGSLTDSLRQQLAFLLLRLSKASEGFLEPSSEDIGQCLTQALESVRAVLPELSSPLVSFSSPDDLCSFFSNLRDLVPTSFKAPAVGGGSGEQLLVEPGSSLGVFLRCCILSFNKLAFESACRLLGSLNLYWGMAGQQLSGLPKVNANMVGHGDFGHAFGHDWLERSRGINFLHGPAEVEKYLQDTAFRIEREVWRVSKNEAYQHLGTMEEIAEDIPQVYFLKFLDGVYRKDYPGAINYVHQYFDLCAGDGSSGKSPNFSHSCLGSRQAGLLSLGSMHGHFGHFNLAFQALSESIHICQQSNDDACLVHTLAVLCHLLSDTSMDGGICRGVYISGVTLAGMSGFQLQKELFHLLKNCLRRAIQLGLPKLILFSELAIAKFDVQNLRKTRLCFTQNTGQMCDKCGIDEDARSWHLAVSKSQRASSSSALSTAAVWKILSGRACHTSKSVMKLMGLSHLLRASSFELFGSEPMMQSIGMVHIVCYMDIASADELSLGYVKLSQQSCNSKGPAAGLLCLSKSRGRFSKQGVLQVHLAQLYLALKISLGWGKMMLSEVICHDLAATVSSPTGVNMEQKMYSNLSCMELYHGCSDFSEAKLAVEALFSLCVGANKHLSSIMLLILTGNIFKNAGDSISGLPYALASFAISKPLNLDLHHATAVVSLAELWVGLGETYSHLSHALLCQFFPVILGHGSLGLQGRSHLIVSQCYLNKPLLGHGHLVLEHLQLAGKAFETVENALIASEVFYLQAIVFDAMGELAKRDEAAMAYKMYSQLLCT